MDQTSRDAAPDPVPPAPDDLTPEPDLAAQSRSRMQAVLILTVAVLVFAVLIAFWMYWMGGQLPSFPGGSQPTS